MRFGFIGLEDIKQFRISECGIGFADHRWCSRMLICVHGVSGGGEPVPIANPILADRRALGGEGDGPLSGRQGGLLKDGKGQQAIVARPHFPQRRPRHSFLARFNRSQLPPATENGAAFAFAGDRGRPVGPGISFASRGLDLVCTMPLTGKWRPYYVPGGNSRRSTMLHLGSDFRKSFFPASVTLVS
jgi:hypothetical protein